MKLINAETITGVMLLLSVIAAESIIANDEEGTSHEEIEEASHEEMTNVVLFPWLSMLIGVVAYYLLSRYLHALPYTAVMFMSGAILGYAALHFNSHNNAIVDSTRLWLGINGELIILAFLPGLLFLDSYNINSYKFKRSFSQILTFAFPMVLGGTALTALVAYYIFPYGWSFDLSMTFGSILSATDPVAVAVLLNGLGAPSRLKVHVSGESLMNDGSGVVFFQIFSSRFFHSLGFHGFEQVGWARGFVLFFRLSLGGACIGLLFGIGLVAILFNLNRRLSVSHLRPAHRYLHWPLF
jgi:NhaP-type Na+/H+ or K+/H+ antiporter